MAAGLRLIDTHCHIHDNAFSAKFEDKDPDTLVREAKDAGVEQLVCVGTDFSSSRQAIEFCSERTGCFASVAIHPHEAEHAETDELLQDMDAIESLLEHASQSETGVRRSVVAIGECGLDYFYHDDSETHRKQALVLERHLELARHYDLPMIFHIRNARSGAGDPATAHAFDEFFKIFDRYDGIRGVVHSFSATEYELNECLKRGLYIGLNGIMTFTKDEHQLAAAKAVPLKRLLVETDAPFLTPAPHRGKMCKPKHVVVTAQFLSDLRGEDLSQFANQTTQNAQELFGLGDD